MAAPPVEAGADQVIRDAEWSTPALTAVGAVGTARGGAEGVSIGGGVLVGGAKMGTDVLIGDSDGTENTSGAFGATVVGAVPVDVPPKAPGVVVP